MQVTIFVMYTEVQKVQRIREKKIVETFEYFCLLPLQYMVYVGILCVFELKYG